MTIQGAGAWTFRVLDTIDKGTGFGSRPGRHFVDVMLMAVGGTRHWRHLEHKGAKGVLLPVRGELP